MTTNIDKSNTKDIAREIKVCKASKAMKKSLIIRFGFL